MRKSKVGYIVKFSSKVDALGNQARNRMGRVDSVNFGGREVRLCRERVGCKLGANDSFRCATHHRFESSHQSKFFHGEAKRGKTSV
jgi:hypothetical protein